MRKEWNDYLYKNKYPNAPKLPLNIPKHPEKTYKNKGWSGYRKWFSYKKITRSKLNINQYFKLIH